MTSVLVIGSNYGDRINNVKKAIDFLGDRYEILNCSEIYESPDLLGTGVPYLNAVVEISISNDEDEVNRVLKKFETDSGRDTVRRSRGEVPVDIDIVIWNEKIRRQKDYESAYFLKGYEQIMVVKNVKMI